MGRYQKPTPGDDITGLLTSASYHGELIDMINASRRQGDLGASLWEDFGIGPGKVLVQNDSLSDVDEYQVLGIDGVLFDPSSAEESFRARSVALSCVTPTDPEHLDKFVITTDPIPDGDIGEAVIAGVIQATVDVTDEDHGFAKIKHGVSTTLESTDLGAMRILYKPTGTGDKWCVVAFVSLIANTKWGFLDGALGQGGSASFSVCNFDGSTQIDTGEDITVWDVQLNVGDDDIPAETRGVAQIDQSSGRWIFTSGNCAAEETANLPQVPE